MVNGRGGITVLPTVESQGQEVISFLVKLTTKPKGEEKEPSVKWSGRHGLYSVGYLAGIFLLLSRKELGGNIIMQEKGGRGEER